jgi:hypothetical protein
MGSILPLLDFLIKNSVKTILSRGKIVFLLEIGQEKH